MGLAGTRLAKLEWGGWVAVAFSAAAMVLGVAIAVGEMLAPGTYVNAQFTWLHLAGSPGPFPNGISLVLWKKGTEVAVNVTGAGAGASPIVRQAAQVAAGRL